MSELFSVQAERRDGPMDDIAATSLSRRAARAGRRFLAEVAISAMATLGVTLALSGWLRREVPAAPQVLPVSAAMPTLAAPTMTAASPETPNDAGLRLLRSMHAENGKPSPQNAADPAAAALPRRAELPRPRGHGARPSCASPCAAHSVVATTQGAVPAGLAAADPQALPPRPWPEAQQHSQYADAPIPPLPIPAASARLTRSLLGPVATMSELISGLAGKW